MPAHQLTTAPTAPTTGWDDDLGWAQVHIEYTQWPTAAATTSRAIRPVLHDLGLGDRWWFVRKHPCWRIRYHRDGGPPDADRRLAATLDALVTDSVLRSWHPTIYEPETRAFGGPAAMRVAHDLFCRDSNAVLDLFEPAAHPTGIGVTHRTELSVLAISRLLRAAGQEWFEQGDIWARVADIRRDPDTPPRPTAVTAAAAVHRLLTLDTGPDTPLTAHGPLTRAASWLTAFDDAGHGLAALARHGHLQRGLRAVLTHHVIFHWNRLGLPRRDQLSVATLARDTVLAPHPPATP